MFLKTVLSTGKFNCTMCSILMFFFFSEEKQRVVLFHICFGSLPLFEVSAPGTLMVSLIIIIIISDTIIQLLLI